MSSSSCVISLMTPLHSTFNARLWRSSLASEADRTELFLSYDRADGPFVEQLASSLADAGVRVWFDRWELAPGDHLGEGVAQTLSEAAAIGVCIGRRGLTRWQSS